MKTGRRGVRIARNPFRRRVKRNNMNGDHECDRRSDITCLDMTEFMDNDGKKAENENSTITHVLSPLPDIISKFIIESANKDYHNQETEADRKEYAKSLRHAFGSIKNGNRPSASFRNNVVELLAETTETVLDSIDNDAEQELFLRFLNEHLNDIGR